MTPAYTVFSLWDTFRGFHPLKTIIDSKRNNEFILSLLAKYEEGGILPMWELAANYTGTMIGYHAIPVIVDAYMKGSRDFDPDGLSGNEDCGQMAAWYILNAMGFYSFCPGDTDYSIGRPLFDKVEINLENKKEFVINSTLTD